jgi:hypothetical protein
MTSNELLAIITEAAGNGHSFAWDPPAALTSLRGRWTCKWCHRSVLMRHDETCYGSATSSDCCSVPKVDQVWQSLEPETSGLRIKVTAIDEQGTTFDAEVVTSPYGKSLAYPVGRSMRVSRSRLCQPAQYKWGYVLVEDVTE